MAVALNTQVVETKVVASVQITGFSINYENLEMKSEYMTLLEDGTPFQRGSATSTDATRISALMDEIEAKVLAGTTMEVASSEVAYSFVLEHLG